jgi:peptide/nickel transport system substrate-binding protein
LRIGAALPTEGAAGSGLRGLISSLTSDSLMQNEPDGRQSQHLARGWTWDESHTTLRIKFRDDVYFHDGTHLTPALAADILKTAVAKHDSISFSSVSSVGTASDDTVELKLSAPDSFLLGDLGALSVTLPGNPQVGTGPFALVKRGAGNAELRSFSKYYRGHPAIDRINIETYQTQRKAWAAMMRGNVDVLHEVSRDAVEFVEAERSVQTFTFPRAYYIPLVFNLRHPILRRVEVRRAINQAIDKAVLVKDGLRGRGRPADGPVWPEHWAYTAVQHPFSFNPDAATLLLDNAGLRPRATKDGSMPSRFGFTCLVYGDSRFERIALLLQKQLYDVGIDMRLEPVSQLQLVERAGKGDFDAFLFEMVSGKALSWVYDFWHSPTDQVRINTGYHSADEVLERLRRSRSDQEVRAATADLNRVLQEDPPAAFLAWQVQSRAVSAKFNVPADPNRDVMGSTWQWTLATHQVARAIR